ncbi:MAG: IPTL-CTERM sorting domain-containing protein [Acidobacteriota bacterium]|nr:IPTL-CTERM sorting domain-containing protein [Acidobacteriota bacterium]
MRFGPSFRFVFVMMLWALVPLSGGIAEAQPLQKSAVQVDAGNTKLTGETFAYRLTYRCNATAGDCINARVVDALPPEVVFVSAVGTTDVATINAPAVGSTGTVEFIMVSPLTAGNSGDLVINVRFPNGSTPDGTLATNTATAENLDPTLNPFTTPPVDVTAVAQPEVDLTKTLLTAANLDLPTTYRLRIQVPNTPGRLNVSGISVTDTLPTGDLIAQPPIFNGASPAADCEPGCVGTRPASLTWSGPFSVNVGGAQNINVTVTFDSASFSNGASVTNEFTADGTPLGEVPQNFGIGSVTHPVTVFVANPSAGFDKRIGPGPNPPTLNQPFSYQLLPSNNGNVPLDNMVVIDTLPIQVAVDSITTGAYNGVTGSVQVSYETNLSAGFVVLGSSPAGTNASFNIPALGAGEYVTRLRWEYGQAAPGMGANSSGNRPRINARVIDPDNVGNPVIFGDTVSNCADLTAVYDPGGANTPVSRMDCQDFSLSGPFTQHSPNKVLTTGSGPYGVGATVGWSLRIDNETNASDPLPLEDLVVVDLLPRDLVYVAVPGWSWDDNGTGLPAPSFEEIANFAGTGRTLLRWTWSAGSGDLLPGQEVRIALDTTVRFGAQFGDLDNVVGQTQNSPGLSQRCQGGSALDDLDQDGDGDTGDRLCVRSRSVTIAPVAQLVSSKAVRGLCDADFVSASSGTLPGGVLDYRLEVRNVGTIPMEDFVLVDILPFVGDTGVLDLSPRDSQWRPLLAAPVTPPPGTTLFYSTSGNPCRPEVGGPAGGCDAPGWTTVPPSPISLVQSIKVEFGDRAVQPADTVEFVFRLIAPADAPGGGLEAFNSFAYLAQRSDGLGSLSAEPNKVGIAIGTCTAAALGDFVWLDTNGNGIQDDGPTGLNDVYVELFTPGADGIPRTFDDVPVGSTVTADDAGGAAGWYEFPALPPGDYYVQFQPPPTYTVTASGAGGDATLDSDADPFTACSPVVTLGMGEQNPDVDLGLLAPPVAALGNYVWFDRDGDGIQNESTFDGANGVAVKLFVDDGDGVPEPGADDGMPVATTATDDDVYGNPGYYLFDGLTPGVPYFVQFMLPTSASGFTSADQGGDDGVDSDAGAGGVTPVVILAPGEENPTLDAGLVAPVGDLVLGDQVWCDDDNDGEFEPQDGELGVNGVRLNLYLDDGDGVPTLDEFIGSTVTFTSAGVDGIYRFEELGDGDYIVEVDLINFSGGAPLEGKVSSSGNDPAPDPDDDANGDDNGANQGALVASLPVTLTDNGEPTTDDGDDDTNLTVDFGFATTAAPEYDYGDAPDVVAGTAAGDYRTTALDQGAAHLQGVAGAPFLGSCVDADNGTYQDPSALADDVSSFGTITGTCALPGGDEDGVVIANPLTIGSVASFQVTASSGTNDCVLDAWVDWDRSGTFGDSAGEQIAASLLVTAGSSVNLTPVVPATARPGLTYSRFRCSSAGGLGPDDLAADGEVEDHLVGVRGMDWADAPDSYDTLASSGGPSHEVDPTAALLLGACVDFETDGQPAVGALGDDVAVAADRVGLCLDDEDGVVFDTPVIACQDAALTVTTNAAGVLDAWIDFDGDGTFGGAGERIANGLAVAAGANPLVVPVPCNSMPGVSHARFRLSSSGVADFGGPAPDGEVEDYALTISGNDWADAPDSYRTTLSVNGPRHGIVSGSTIFLGSCVDGEPNGQPSGGADGDDVAVGVPAGTCVGGDDEDGVVFTAPVVACQTAFLTVTASSPGVLDAWFDFAGDGNFSAVGDRIFSAQGVNAGANALSFNVPCTATPGLTYARFRFSSAGVSSFEGPSADGEVEDYLVQLRAPDLGDAPDSYGTLFGSGGPTHGVDPAGIFFLGACADTEVEGQPAVGADGDDLGAGTTVAGLCNAGDDEDGVSFAAPLVACGSTSVTVLAGSAGILDGWLDFGADGNFTAPTDRVFTAQAVAAGANNLTINVPCTAVPGQTYGRFRFSGSGVPGPGGPSPDGEVEDYLLEIRGVDFGDAPDSYPTTFASSGPYHGVDPAGSLYLGACVDTESDASAPLDASGDDADASGSTAGTCAGGDDEDGVVFDTRLVACKGADLTLTAGAAGLLDAWIDFNGDGSFAGEQVFTNEPLTAGANSLSFTVPCDLTEGATYARFRLSSAGGLTPSGGAADGEVEDYVLAALGSDFGDAPDSYGTTEASGGPSHGVDAAQPIYLGSCVDSENDAVAPLDSTGDDLGGGDATVGTCVGGDDEDGVSFDSEVVACQTSSITVTASAAGLLDAWIDFGADGSFAEAEDRIFTAQVLVPGANALTFDAPCSTVAAAVTFARFRFSTGGVAGSGGTSPDGEVEDYRLETREADLGDAPDSYGTTVAAGGASHGLVSGFHLGATVDAEQDGQPSGGADGDGDDEDGVVFAGGMAMASACDSTSLEVTLTNTAALSTAVLDAWIDFDGDGTFDEPRDRIATALALVDGANTVSYDIPCDAASAESYARFRLSTQGVAVATGQSPDGEVEDYAFVVKGLDFGDAPDPTYPTLLASNGARHSVLPVANPTLGAVVDTEPDGQPSPSHNGDDQNGSPDDEDGVTFPGVLIPGTEGAVTIATGSAGGLVSAWIDFNQDGDWADAGEQILSDVTVGASASLSLPFSVPVGSLQGTACARFRISSQGGLTPSGAAADGEVEDHLAAVGVEEPALGVAKQLVSIEEDASMTYLVTFDILLSNLGNVPLSDVQATGDFATAFAAAASVVVDSVSSMELVVNPAFDGTVDIDLLAAGNTLAVGASGRLRIVLLVDPGGFAGPYVCSSVGTAVSPGGELVTDVSQDGDDPDADGDGDATDDNDPTELELPVSVLEIPTLGQWGLILLSALLMLAAIAILRRHRAMQ